MLTTTADSYTKTVSNVIQKSRFGLRTQSTIVRFILSSMTKFSRQFLMSNIFIDAFRFPHRPRKNLKKNEWIRVNWSEIAFARANGRTPTFFNGPKIENWLGQVSLVANLFHIRNEMSICSAWRMIFFRKLVCCGVWRLHCKAKWAKSETKNGENKIADTIFFTSAFFTSWSLIMLHRLTILCIFFAYSNRLSINFKTVFFCFDLFLMKFYGHNYLRVDKPPL